MSMGLFSKKSTCDICNSNKGKEVKDGFVCNECWNKTGDFGSPLTSHKNLATLNQIKERIKLNDQWNIEHNKRKNIFCYTMVIGDKLLVDEENRLWCINIGTIKPKPSNVIYSVDDIEDYELEENGESIVKGSLVRTAMGGIAFGTMGAIIGNASSKKIQEICNRLVIKVTIKNQYYPIRIDLITKETKKNSFMYKSMLSNAEKILKYFDKM